MVSALTVVAAIGIAVVLLGVRLSAVRQVPKHAAQRAPTRAEAPAPAVSVAAVALAPAVAAAPAERPASAAAFSIVPVIPQGRRDLNPAMFAERVGDTVIVNFDTRDTRTRRPAKFESTVRETLPAVYGAVADSMLSVVPQGRLTAGGDLITELPTRGIRLTAPNGAAITLWPETRPGRDGPLVVNYRVAPAR